MLTGLVVTYILLAPAGGRVSELFSFIIITIA